MITVAQAMVKCLENEGINVVYGYPGAAICPFYDELYKSDIHHVLVRHEANAGHSASGYARMTNRPAVCIATSGPGATNLVTAIATAYMDSVPLICITGQVSSEQIGSDAFQEADITGSAEPFVKYSYLVKNAQDLPRIFKEAFYLAGTGRKGPVLIDVPMDIQFEKIDFEYPETVSMRTYKPNVKGNTMQTKKICDAISSAKRPLICVGGGLFLADITKEFKEFAETSGIPVITTMMGIGALPTAHPLCMGMLGMHGVKTANYALSKTDCLILLGARASDRSVKSPDEVADGTTIIHIDIDPAEIGKNIRADYPLVGDLKKIIPNMTESIGQLSIDEWKAELSEIKNHVPVDEETQGYINPKMFLRLLSHKLPDNTVCVADVGQNQIWACNNFEMKNGRFLTSGGMGTMGYSLPCAIGAKMAAPDSQVVVICGDGSFQMCLQELATVMQENLDIKIILMKNRRLGMVRELQTRLYEDRQIAVGLNDCPDFIKLVESYGIPARRVSSYEEAVAAADEMVGSKGPFFIECNVYKFESTL